MTPECGQQVGRQERVEETRRWLGASPVGDDGQIKEASAGISPEAIQNEVDMIRNSLASGMVAQVRVDISDETTIAAIKELLTPEERAKVLFGSEEFPAA